MRRRPALVLTALVLTALVAATLLSTANAKPKPRPTPTPSTSATETPTPTPSATPSASASPSVTPTPPSPFVTAAGQTLLRNGQPVQLHGFNSYGIDGCYSGTPYTAAELEAYFAGLPTHGVTRFWAFRGDGVAHVQRVVDAAGRYGQLVVPVLANSLNTCDGSDYAQNGGKSLAYYQGGWRDFWKPWAETVVPTFKDRPEILAWETINEPGASNGTNRPDLATWQTYFDQTTALIGSLDQNHLITVGANAPGHFGSSANFITLMGTPSLSLIQFHDYSYEYENKAVVSNNFKVAQQAAGTHNKPFFAGEVGAKAGTSSTCSLTPTTRAEFMKSKADQYFAGGIDALAYWQWVPYKASWVAACAHEMYPDDPMVNQVRNGG